jgi:hypothetical protein
VTYENAPKLVGWLCPAQEFTGEGMQNLCLCSALMAFDHGGIFIVPHMHAVTWGLGFSGLIRRTAPFCLLLRHKRGCGKSFLTRILKGPLSVASYDTQGDVEDLFLPGSTRVMPKGRRYYKATRGPFHAVFASGLLNGEGSHR